MALVFTDDQVKKLTSDSLLLPALILRDTNGKDVLSDQEDDLIKEDSQNKVFSEHYIGIEAAYHNELEALNGSVRTDYNESYIQAGARQQNGHFTGNTPNLIPILLPINNGNPITSVLDYEINKIPPVLPFFPLILTGFNDGALTDSLAEAYVIGQPLKVNTGGFSIGQRVVVDQANQSLIGVITNASATSGSCSNPIHLTESACLLGGGVWTPPTGAESLVITVLSNPAVTLGVGARVRNFHPGFSLSERQGLSTPYAPEVLTYWTDQLLAKVNDWRPYLILQQTALNANDVEGSEAGDVSLALGKVEDALFAIDAFISAPYLGINGKVDDSILMPLLDNANARTTDAPLRVAEIISALGSVSQAGDYSYSGTGHYFNIWKWVDLRINLAGGSLSRQLQVRQGISFFESSIAIMTAQKAEYDDTFLIKQFDGEGDGSEFIALQDVAGLSIGDNVMVMDNDSLVYDREIADIQGNVIELDSAIGVILATTKLARVVKRL